MILVHSYTKCSNVNDRLAIILIKFVADSVILGSPEGLNADNR